MQGRSSERERLYMRQEGCVVRSCHSRRACTRMDLLRNSGDVQIGLVSFLPKRVWRDSPSHAPSRARCSSGAFQAPCFRLWSSCASLRFRVYTNCVRHLIAKTGLLPNTFRSFSRAFKLPSLFGIMPRECPLLRLAQFSILPSFCNW